MGMAPAVLAQNDVDQIRGWTETGEALPLEQIIHTVQARLPGRAIKVELERESGVLLYELEWLDSDGRVWELKVDARSGKILKQERD